MTRIDHVAYQLECGTAVWRVRAVVLEEALNRPFRAELRVVSTDPRSTADLLDLPAVLTLTRGRTPVGLTLAIRHRA